MFTSALLRKEKVKWKQRKYPTRDNDSIPFEDYCVAF